MAGLNEDFMCMFGTRANSDDEETNEKNRRKGHHRLHITIVGLKG